MMKEIADVVIVSACRTPIAKFLGSLKDFQALDLAVDLEDLRRVVIERVDRAQRPQRAEAEGEAARAPDFVDRRMHRQRQALAGLFQEDAVVDAVDRDRQVAPGNGFEIRHRAPPSRA